MIPAVSIIKAQTGLQVPAKNPENNPKIPLPQFMKDRLYKNISPFSYHDKRQRFFDALLFNNMDPARAKVEAIAAGKDSLTLGNSFAYYREDNQKRLDAYAKYMGKPERWNTFGESKFKPSRSTDPDAKYYTFNNKDEIQNYLLRILNWYGPDKGKIDGTGSYLDVTSVMGQYKVGLGKDALGDYMSFYDKWDLDPIDFGKPFEIYDRFYFKKNDVSELPWIMDDNGEKVNLDLSDPSKLQYQFFDPTEKIKATAAPPAKLARGGIIKAQTGLRVPTGVKSGFQLDTKIRKSEPFTGILREPVEPVPVDPYAGLTPMQKDSKISREADKDKFDLINEWYANKITQEKLKQHAIDISGEAGAAKKLAQLNANMARVNRLSYYNISKLRESPLYYQHREALRGSGGTYYPVGSTDYEPYTAFKSYTDAMLVRDSQSTVHEAIHASDFDDDLLPIINKYLSRDIMTSVTNKLKELWPGVYGNDTPETLKDEVYPRIMEWRLKSGFQPGRKYSTDDIKSFKTMFKMFEPVPDEILINLFDDIAMKGPAAGKWNTYQMAPAAQPIRAQSGLRIPAGKYAVENPIVADKTFVAQPPPKPMAEEFQPTIDFFDVQREAEKKHDTGWNGEDWLTDDLSDSYNKVRTYSKYKIYPTRSKVEGTYERAEAEWKGQEYEKYFEENPPFVIKSTMYDNRRTNAVIDRNLLTKIIEAADQYGIDRFLSVTIPLRESGLNNFDARSLFYNHEFREIYHKSGAAKTWQEEMSKVIDPFQNKATKNEWKISAVDAKEFANQYEVSVNKAKANVAEKMLQYGYHVPSRFPFDNEMNTIRRFLNTGLGINRYNSEHAKEFKISYKEALQQDLQIIMDTPELVDFIMKFGSGYKPGKGKL